jgi:hypothetical protein
MVYDSSDSNCRSVGLVMGYGNNLFGVFEVQFSNHMDTDRINMFLFLLKSIQTMDNLNMEHFLCQNSLKIQDNRYRTIKATL